MAARRCCRNRRFAPAAADIHSHHTQDANSSTHSTSQQVGQQNEEEKNKSRRLRSRFPLRMFRTDANEGAATDNTSTASERKIIKETEKASKTERSAAALGRFPQCKVGSDKSKEVVFKGTRIQHASSDKYLMRAGVSGSVLLQPDSLFPSQCFTSISAPSSPCVSAYV